MQSSDIRTVFLDFFTGKGHLVMPSFPLIPQNDPTLLLIGAGMAPLKPFFTGEKKPPHTRIATCQKCVRTPDIDRVGLTGRHATFFEMLGNFSFGDYFKEEAIAWAWELVLEGYRLPREKLWVSIYEEDEEAFTIWHRRIGLPPDRIVRLGKKDNFWEIGLGPCGPCSEIYYDLGLEAGCGREQCAVGCDCDRYLEIWNLVFTQYNREPSGELTVLKQQNIDTGAGLERLAMALQNVPSFYETDLIRPVYEYFASLSGTSDRGDKLPLRIITEHSRGITFLVADGVVPANEGRGYVLRRLLRRASRYGRLLGIEGGFLAGAVPLIGTLMGSTYRELKERQDYIMQVIKTEENRFQETLSQGMEILEGYIAALREQERQALPGNLAFKLYDTYGFPLDLTEEILAEQGFTIDKEAFSQNLNEQQARARAARPAFEQAGRSAYEAAENLETIFTGYETLQEESRLMLLLVGGEPRSTAGEGEEVELFLDRTPFYAEAGGQTGDTGVVFTGRGRATVQNTVFTPRGRIVHQARVESGTLSVGEPVSARVEEGRRRGVCRSHTATHLLHRALKDKLGGQVNQAGSLVTADRLRFDFTHFSGLTQDELREVEEKINRRVLQNMPVNAAATTLEEAQRMGATALFMEKYDRELVRVVSAGDYSRELCGGTHVAATGEIGLVRLISEEGIGSGLRRIEALTGMEAYRYSAAESARLAQMAKTLHTGANHLERRVEEVLEENRLLQKANQELKQQLAGFAVKELLERVRDVEGVKVLSAVVSAESLETLRLMIDQVKSNLSSVVVVLGAVSDGKVILAGAVSGDLIKQGLKANNIITTVARQVGGGGGGRPELAQAGGKNPAGLPAALQAVEELVRRQVAAGR
jgi:alanyl-tRNA synthetase